MTGPRATTEPTGWMRSVEERLHANERIALLACAFGIIGLCFGLVALVAALVG